MNKRALVSIVIPTYNSEKYLSDCLKSVYNQTHKNTEVIIINDGSSDGSEKVIKKFYKKYKNSTIILNNNKASGSGEVASNGGIKLAKGKYVAIMDSDDMSLPNRIEKEVDFLEKNLDYFLVSSSAVVIDENNKKICNLDVGKNYLEILKKIYLTNSIINSSVMFRKSEIKDDFYKIKYPFFNDYYSWFHYLKNGKKIFTLKQRLVKYRINLTSSTRQNLKRNYKISFCIKDEIRKESIFKIKLLDNINIFCQKILVELLPAKLIDKLYLWKLKWRIIK